MRLIVASRCIRAGGFLFALLYQVTSVNGVSANGTCRHGICSAMRVGFVLHCTVSLLKSMTLTSGESWIAGDNHLQRFVQRKSPPPPPPFPPPRSDLVCCNQLRTSQIEQRL